MNKQKEIDKEKKETILAKCSTIPAFSALNVSIKEMYDGECVAIVPHNKNFDGIFESYHGGMLMTAADTIAVVALMTKTGTELNFATTDMNIRFLAKCLTDVKVHAKVIKNGKTLSLMQINLFDLNDKLVAIAQVNYINF